MFVWPNMVGFYIGKDTEIKSDSGGSVQHQSLRGYFHDHAVAAFVCHLCKIFLDEMRFGCGVGGGYVFFSDDGLDGADQSYFVTGVFEDGFDQIGGGGFSFGSCNADGF